MVRDGERDRDGDPYNPPLSDPAGNADAGREPGAGGAGQPADPEVMLGADDDAGAEKTNAGEDALDDAAGGIGNLRAFRRWIGQHHHHGGGKPDQTQRLQSDRLAVQIAI